MRQLRNVLEENYYVEVGLDEHNQSHYELQQEEESVEVSNVEEEKGTPQRLTQEPRQMTVHMALNKEPMHTTLMLSNDSYLRVKRRPKQKRIKTALTGHVKRISLPGNESGGEEEEEEEEGEEEYEEEEEEDEEEDEEELTVKVVNEVGMAPPSEAPSRRGGHPMNLKYSRIQPAGEDEEEDEGPTEYFVDNQSVDEEPQPPSQSHLMSMSGSKSALDAYYDPSKSVWIGKDAHPLIYNTAVNGQVTGINWLSQEQKEDLVHSCEVREGYGLMLWDDGSRYEGDWKRGRPNGLGLSRTATGFRYKGNWKNGMMNGSGQYRTPEGATYDGEWRENKRDGQGTEHSLNGTIYTGQFKQDLRHGNGTITWPDGSTYKGDWSGG